MRNEQIELNFQQERARVCNASRHQRRRGRAQWWFQQMRLAVDRAVDWTPAPVARPEQTYMPLR
ncbi:MAG TPA: hypothetical protein DCM86_07445 [Verrucomicrobiales bacterium]|nr:hypothetical protein [Verrucomicrobiales bacterium]